jgi:hypothetical protein
MDCLDERVAEPLKFMDEYKITVHYRNGTKIEACIGGHCAAMDDGTYRLPCDLAAVLRETVTNQK